MKNMLPVNSLISDGITETNFWRHGYPLINKNNVKEGEYTPQNTYDK